MPVDGVIDKRLKHTWAHRGHGRSTSILEDDNGIRLHRSTTVTSQVLYANAHPSVSHMSANFVAVFGESIRMTRHASRLVYSSAKI